MKYKFYSLTLFLLFFCQLTHAHNTQQASFKLVIAGKNSFIDISFSQYGSEQALLKLYPDLNLNSPNASAFKETLIRHLKENIHISINGEKLKIGGGLIKLGSHQSEVKFKVSNIKGKPKYLDVKVTCFDKNDRKINIFKVSYDTQNARSLLNTENNYHGYFKFTGSKIEVSHTPLPSKLTMPLHSINKKIHSVTHQSEDTSK